jgi:hypothetical protein
MAASLLPIPRWEELPTNRREELLRILGRMLTEQVERTAATKGVNDEPR